MNTKLSYVEFLQQLNEPKSILYKLYDIKYNNCNINTDWYFFSPATGNDKIKLPSLTLTEWINEWSDICHRFTFRYKLVDNESAPYIFGDITLVTFETREFKRTSLSATELYTLLACASTIKAHNLYALVDCCLADNFCDPDVVDNIINKLTTLALEGASDDTTYVVEEFYE